MMKNEPGSKLCDAAMRMLAGLILKTKFPTEIVKHANRGKVFEIEEDDDMKEPKLPLGELIQKLLEFLQKAQPKGSGVFDF